MLIYLGFRSKVYKIVTGDVFELEAGPSIAVCNHSNELIWGYSGSGPAQLSLALLLDATGLVDISTALHQRFKDEFVAAWGDEFVISSPQIVEWARKVLAEDLG